MFKGQREDSSGGWSSSSGSSRSGGSSGSDNSTKTYDLINGRTFEGTYYSEQIGFSIVSGKMRIKFTPSSISKGTAYIEYIGKVASAIQGQSGNNRDTETTTYYITDKGEIVVLDRIFKADSDFRNLNSDIKDNRGWTVTFYRR